MTEDEMVEYLFEQIETGRRGGASLSQAKSTLRQNPFGAPPENLLDRAESLFLERTGQIMSVPDPAVLMEQEHNTGSWYTGPRDQDVFWPPYRDLLVDKIGEPATGSVDDASSKILQLMRPPGETFNTRGLVLGYVQSGKTTNFISLIAKAADAGYKLFIVLSGITDNLRSQTQERIDEFVEHSGASRWESLTTKELDFDGRGARLATQITSSDAKLVAVVKKNPARLRRLMNWLNETPAALLARCPILLIDDEADQASIDVGPKGRTSTINRLLREILDSPKVAYVAYTATPFANLLVDPTDQNDIYPRDFLVSLPEPSGYFGPELIFGSADQLDQPEDEATGLDIVRPIPEHEAENVRPPRPASALETWEPVVPAAMERALRWFILATATRRYRGRGNPHSTMLIHTSMLARAHQLIGGAVKEWFSEEATALADPNSAVWGELKIFWESEAPRSNPTIPEDFESIKQSVLETVSKTRIIYDNYLSTERLTYEGEEPVTTIVIGGNTLSRGLTLEGLTSSYFVRAASAYDTLLQMGRWFGYRAHYEDLVRIWMPDELQNWFRDLSLVESEIRQQIQRYESERLTPEAAAVRIRTHPAMAITSAAKMRSAVDAQITYSRSRAQTIAFKHKDRSWLEENIQATRNLVSALSKKTDEHLFPSGRRGFKNVSVNQVLRYLHEYRFDERATRVSSELLTKYIRNEMDAEGLLRWNVVFIEGRSDRDKHKGIDLGLAEEVTPMNRSRIASDDTTTANLKSIASAIDRISDLPIQPKDAGKRLASISATTPGLREKDAETPLLMLRQGLLGSTGLLCLYPIDPASVPQRPGKGRERRQALEAVAPVIGISIFFPEAVNPVSTVSYKSVDLSAQVYEDPVDELADVDSADAEDERTISEEQP